MAPARRSDGVEGDGGGGDSRGRAGLGHFVDKFWHVARDSSINSILAKGTQPGVTLYQFDLPGFYLQSAPDDATFEHEKPPLLYIWGLR
jgi:hypothetical protein